MHTHTYILYSPLSTHNYICGRCWKSNTALSHQSNASFAYLLLEVVYNLRDTWHCIHIDSMEILVILSIKASTNMIWISIFYNMYFIILFEWIELDILRRNKIITNFYLPISVSNVKGLCRHSVKISQEVTPNVHTLLAVVTRPWKNNVHLNEMPQH